MGSLLDGERAALFGRLQTLLYAPNDEPPNHAAMRIGRAWASARFMQAKKALVTSVQSRSRSGDQLDPACSRRACRKAVRAMGMWAGVKPWAVRLSPMDSIM